MYVSDIYLSSNKLRTHIHVHVQYTYALTRNEHTNQHIQINKTHTHIYYEFTLYFSNTQANDDNNNRYATIITIFL